MNLIAFESLRASTIKSSPSIAAKGEHGADFSLGEPDFDTPAHIAAALARLR